MSDLETVNKSDIGPDGKLRRKYEVGEEPESQMLTRISIGSIMASAALLFKNIAFGPDRADDRIDDLLGNENYEDISSVKDTDDDKALSRLSNHKDRNDRTGKNEKDSSFDNPANSNRKSSANPESRFDRNQVEERVSEYPVAKNTGPANSGQNPGEARSNILPFPGADQNTTPPVVNTRSINSREGTNPQQQGDRQRSVNDENNEATADTRQNRAPVVSGPVYLDNLYVNQSMLLTTALLLSGALDPDGDQLEIQNLVASSGELQSNFDASWTFIPEAFDTGDVTFSYKIFDGENSIDQSAFIDLLELPGADFVGTENNDRIVGSSGSSRIASGNGNDTLIGRQNADVIDAGGGDDRIVAGAGDDVVYARAGNDIVIGGAGNDLLVGGGGNDILSGEAGNDTMLGEQGNDTLIGGDGDDRGFGGSENDQILGDAGDDLLDGGTGEDDISGGADNDTLIGGANADTINGDDGDDTFIALTGDGDDHCDGGEGSDTYDLSGTSSDAVIDLAANTASSDDIGTDTIVNFENVVAGAGNDVIIANDQQNNLFGNLGADTFVFHMANSNSGPGQGRDRIEDFEVGDIIDVRAFDGDNEQDGLQALTFNFDQATFDGVGQVLLRYEEQETGEVTILQFNTDIDEDGDEVDFEIEIVGRHQIDENNFLT